MSVFAINNYYIIKKICQKYYKGKIDTKIIYNRKANKF